jgi:hypothetical protein
MDRLRAWLKEVARLSPTHLVLLGCASGGNAGSECRDMTPEQIAQRDKYVETLKSEAKKMLPKTTLILIKGKMKPVPDGVAEPGSPPTVTVPSDGSVIVIPPTN